MERLGECIGDRGGTWYHKFDGFYYKVHTKNDNNLYLVCAVYRCPARASMPNKKADHNVKNFKMTGSHNHPPNMHMPQLLALRKTLKSRSENEFTPLKQIFDEEIAKVHESVHKLITFRSYSATMLKYRRLMQRSIMSAIVDGEEGECVEVSEIEYEENPVSEDDSNDNVQPHDNPVVNGVESKRKRKHTLPEILVKKNKYNETDGEITIETSYLEEEEPLGNTFDGENYNDTNWEDKSESQDEDLEECLKFYQSKPKALSNQCNDLLSTFFREMEKTVRSFLPSVIIEAKASITSLVYKLEMKNWQVQQLLEQREPEKEKKHLKEKQFQEKEQTKQKHKPRVRLNTKMIQKQLLQQQLKQQDITVNEENQQLPEHEEVLQEELEEYYQLVDAQDQLTDEQYQVINQQDQSVNEENQMIQEQQIVNSEFAGGTVRILNSPARSTPGNFQNVRIIKAKIVPKKKLDVGKTVTE